MTLNGLFGLGELNYEIQDYDKANEFELDPDDPELKGHFEQLKN